MGNRPPNTHRCPKCSGMGKSGGGDCPKCGGLGYIPNG